MKINNPNEESLKPLIIKLIEDNYNINENPIINSRRMSKLVEEFNIKHKTDFKVMLEKNNDGDIKDIHINSNILEDLNELSIEDIMDRK